MLEDAQRRTAEGVGERSAEVARSVQDRKGRCSVMSRRGLSAAVLEPSRFSSRILALEPEVAELDAGAVIDAQGATARLAAVLSARGATLAAQEARPAAPPTADLLGAKAAAKRLGLSTPTIYRLTARGELPAVRVGDSVRFDPADLARFIEIRKSGAHQVRQ